MSIIENTGNIENLVIDSDPKIDEKNLRIETEFYVDTLQEISISVNNSIILDKKDITDIKDNCIELSRGTEIHNTDSIVVIYNKV